MWGDNFRSRDYETQRRAAPAVTPLPPPEKTLVIFDARGFVSNLAAPVAAMAEQLRASNPGADWNAQGVDRAQELAEIFNRAGITSLLGLALAKSQKRETRTVRYGREGDKKESFVVEGLCFYVRDTFYGWLGTNKDRQAWKGELFEDQTRVAWSSSGHGAVSYVLKAGSPGKFTIAPVWSNTNEIGFYRDILKMTFLAVALVTPLAGISITAQLGAGIVGSSFAAAYPVLTQAIGATALSTALNGGDVEAAAKSAALGAAAGGAGSFVGAQAENATSLESIGVAANAATRAYIIGGDVEKAIAISLLKQGAIALDDLQPVAPYDPVFDPNTPAEGETMFENFDDSGDPYAVFDYAPVDESPVFYDAVFDPATPAETWAPVDMGPPPLFGPDDLPMIEYNPPDLAPVEIPQINLFPAAPATDATPAKTPGFFEGTNVFSNITNAALAALNVAAKAKQVLADPNAQIPVNTQARTVSPNGTVRTVGSDGLIHAQLPNGAQTSARPPVGQPQAALDGSFVVNNGNGTYTRVTGAGAAQTFNYETGAGGSMFAGLSNVNPAYIMGGIGLLALFLKRGR